MANASVATYTGRSIIWARIKGTGVGEPKYIGWGNPGSTTSGSANPNVNLFQPATEARATGTSSVVTYSQLADTYQVVGTITCLVGGKTITEAGLFDSSTQPPAASLAATIVATTAGATTIATFSSSIVGPTTGSYLMQIENETVIVLGGVTSSLTLTRTQLGSTSAAHAANVFCTAGGDGGASSLGLAAATFGAASPAASGGSMFIHADFAGIALNVNDSIAFTFTDTLT